MNYCLLGLLIEDVTGQDYEDVVKERLLQPSGIDDMRMVGTLEFRKGDAHHLSGEARNYMEVLAAAGAWVGTAEDLVRILDSLDTRHDGTHTLTSATVDAMLEAPRCRTRSRTGTTASAYASGRTVRGATPARWRTAARWCCTGRTG